MRCGRVKLTLFFPLHNGNFLYRIENVVCHLFRTATLVDNGTIEGQIGEGCLQLQLLFWGSWRSNTLSSLSTLLLLAAIILARLGWVR